MAGGFQVTSLHINVGFCVFFLLLIFLFANNDGDSESFFGEKDSEDNDYNVYMEESTGLLDDGDLMEEGEDSEDDSSFLKKGAADRRKMMEELVIVVVSSEELPPEDVVIKGDIGELPGEAFEIEEDGEEKMLIASDGADMVIVENEEDLAKGEQAVASEGEDTKSSKDET